MKPAKTKSRSRSPAPAKRARGTPRVTLIGGDGVGPEVIDAALAVIRATGVAIEWDRQAAGAYAVKRFGTPVPGSVI